MATTDGRVLVDVPALAATERLNVRITTVDPAGLAAVPAQSPMTGYQFDAFAVDRAMASVSTFPADVRIIVNYTEQDLLGRDPDSLRFWTWDERAGEWNELPSTHIPGTGTLVVHVNHFSIDVGTADPAVIAPPFLRSFQTDLQTGASTAAIPLDVPGGRAGLTPNLTLTYSSNRENEMKDELAQGSWVGIGWDLQLGSVRAVYPTSPGDDTRYFLELNGAADELIQDPADATLWRTRHYDGLRVKRVGTSPCGVTLYSATPCYWEVTDKQGTKYYFGGQPSSDTDVADAPTSRQFYTYYWSGPGWKKYYYRWDLRKAIDTHGNKVLYKYQQQQLTDCGGGGVGCVPWVLSAYPETVTYDYNGSTPGATLQFTLRDESFVTVAGSQSAKLRPDAPRDMASSGSCGHFAVGEHSTQNTFGRRVEETRVLDRVNVTIAGQGLRKAYKLTYADTGFGRVSDPTCYASGETKLSSVAVLDKDGNESAPLTTTSFTYQSKSFSFPTGTSISQPFLTQASSSFGGTVNYSYILQTASNRWSRQVVSQQTLVAGISGGPVDMVTAYSYPDDPAYFLPSGSPEDAEFRGFAHVTETRDEGTYGAFTEHDFFTAGSSVDDPDELRSGREKETRVFAKNDTTVPPTIVRYRRIVNEWGTTKTPATCTSGCAYRVSLDRVRSYEGQVPAGANDNATETKVEFDYDDYGNVVFERQLGMAVGTLDDRTVYTPYSANTADWIFLPQLQVVYSGSWSSVPSTSYIQAATAFYYDGKTSALDPAISVGNLTRVERSDDNANPAVYSNVYYQYTTGGNKTAESIPTSFRETTPYLTTGGIPASVPATTWTSFDTTLGTFPGLIIDPVGNQTGPHWDLRLGALDSRDDPSGNTVHFAYDGFGRLTKSWDNSTTATTPSVKYTYNWNLHQNDVTKLNNTLIERLQKTSPNTYTWESHCMDGFGRDILVRRSYTSSADSAVQTGFNRRGLPSYQLRPFSLPFTTDGLCETSSPSSLASPSTLPRTESYYDPFDAPAIVQDIDTTLDPADPKRTETNIVDRNGLVTTAKDANSHKTVSTYDGQGRLSAASEYLGNSDATYTLYANTSYGYNYVDNLTSVTDARGTGPPQTQLTYDRLGRKTAMTDPDMGNWGYRYNAAGDLLEQTDARGQKVAMVYDALGRLTRKCYNTTSELCVSQQSPPVALTYDTYPDGGICPTPNTLAKGHLTKLVDPSGSTNWCFDVRGRETKEHRTITGSGTYDVQREYNLADQLTKLTYPDSEQLTYTYDAYSGQPKVLTTSLSGTYVMDAAYEQDLQPDWLQLGSGLFTDDTYDGRDQLTHLTHQKPGGGLNQDLSYQYDAVGNVTRIEDPSAASDSPTFVPITNLAYDELNRLKFAESIIPGEAARTDYHYSAIGNLDQVNQLDEGVLWDLTYDPNARPHAVGSIKLGGADVRTYQYDANGNVTSVQLNNVDSDQDGDGPGLSDCPDLRELSADVANGGKQDPTYRWDYFNPLGNSGNGTSDLTALLQHYGHLPGDPLYDTRYDRGGAFPGGENWNLRPPNGNINTGDITSIVNEYGHNCATSTAPTSSTVSLTYDTENRLVSKTEFGVTTTYTYDGQGTLVKKVDNGVTTAYVDDLYEVAGSTVTKYYWFNGTRVAMRQAGTPTYLLSDALGSPTASLDASGALLGRQYYYPFGRTRWAVDKIASDKGFTGHQQEGQFYFMQSRFYDPVAGRFLQPDSIVPDYTNPQSLNRYSYVLNNPLRYTDPTGHSVLDFLQNAFSLAWAATIVGQQDTLSYTEMCTLCIATHQESEEEAERRHRLTWDTYYAVQILERHGFSRYDFDWSPDQISYLYDTEYRIDASKLHNGDWWSKHAAEAAALLGFAAPIIASTNFDDSSDALPRIGPGPFAGRSIAARAGRFSSKVRQAVDEIGSDTGCHTCGARIAGTKSGHFIPDHQPPSALNVDNAPQRLYPQCLACSQRQGGLIQQLLNRLKGAR